MRTLIALILLCLLAACQSVPTVPKTVTVVVEKYKPLPDWATKPLRKPMPADGTIGEIMASEFSRGMIIDVANCRARLLLKLDRGEAVKPEDCEL